MADDKTQVVKEKFARVVAGGTAFGENVRLSVLEDAQSICDQINEAHEAVLGDAVTEEREKCARIAEDEEEPNDASATVLEALWKSDPAKIAQAATRVAKTNIAAAIRGQK